MLLDIACVISGAWLTKRVYVIHNRKRWMFRLRLRFLNRNPSNRLRRLCGRRLVPLLSPRSSPAMNICISQTAHNRPKSASEVGRNPYLFRRAERVFFMNSANGFVFFPCRTTRAPCRIAPLKLPIILKFMSPPLRCPEWDVAHPTYLRN